MQLSKAIFTIVFAGTILANASTQQAESSDISAYYGFEEIEIIKLDWGIKDLRVADFNGDGRNDIALVNNRKARIELLVQKEAVGPGETEVAVDPNDIDVNAIIPPTRFERQSMAVSQKLYSLVCGDLNSDGLTDLAFYGEPKGLYVILQKTDEAKADGPESLSWRTRKNIRIDDGLLTSNALVCADLNNDGADDLALAGRGGVYIVVQKDAGSLAEPVKYPTSAQTLSVEASDLDGDKINDLILVTTDMEKPVHVRFGLETGQLGPQVQFFIERPFA
ncbi:MAG: VCBS repeat-containing protein, partial [Phycisphaerales bacterium]